MSADSPLVIYLICSVSRLNANFIYLSLKSETFILFFFCADTRILD